MAIPFYIPDEETASQYRTRNMDELFAQLYNVLRQILMHRPAEPVMEQINVTRTNGQTAAAAERLDDHGADVSNLPDVVPVASRLVDVPHSSQTPQPDLVASLPSRPSRRRDASTATTSNPLPPPRRGRRRRAQRPRADDVPAATAKGGVKEVFECQTYTAYRPERKVEVRDNWTQVGEDLRRIADDFQTSIESLDQKKPLVDPANPKSVSTLLSLLVPSRPYTGSIWMTVILILGWGVLQRAR